MSALGAPPIPGAGAAQAMVLGRIRHGRAEA